MTCRPWIDLRSPGIDVTNVSHFAPWLKMTYTTYSRLSGHPGAKMGKWPFTRNLPGVSPRSRAKKSLGDGAMFRVWTMTRLVIHHHGSFCVLLRSWLLNWMGCRHLSPILKRSRFLLVQDQSNRTRSSWRNPSRVQTQHAQFILFLAYHGRSIVRGVRG